VQLAGWLIGWGDGRRSRSKDGVTLGGGLEANGRKTRRLFMVCINVAAGGICGFMVRKAGYINHLVLVVMMIRSRGVWWVRLLAYM
jgi:hypothetical protein